MWKKILFSMACQYYALYGRIQLVEKINDPNEEIDDRVVKACDVLFNYPNVLGV